MMHATDELGRAAPRATGDLPQARPHERAIVGFEDRNEPSVLRLLAAGFRHCFCVLGDGDRWTLVDPLKARIEILSFGGWTETEVIQQLAGGGRRILRGDRIPVSEAPARPGGNLPRPLTCVEVVKRALDLNAPGVFTPRQLHGTLLRRCGFVELAPL